MNPLLIDEIAILYANYMAIDKHAFQAIIGYYDKNEKYFQFLPVDEQLNAAINYFEALFETGKFYLLLDKIDNALITCVDCNWNTTIKSIYVEMIFKKAAALYNTEQYSAAFALSKELLKIDPNHIAGKELFRRVLANPKPAYILKVHILAVCLVLLSAVLIVIDLSIVKPNYQDLHIILVKIIEGLFIGGMILSFLPDLTHYFISRHKLKRELHKIKKRRSQKV